MVVRDILPIKKLGKWPYTGGFLLHSAVEPVTHLYLPPF